jgi:hypothetical protein
MQHPDHPQHHHPHHYSHHRQNFQQQRQQQQQNEASTSSSSTKVSPAASEIGTGKRQKGALKRAAPSSIAASANINAVPPAGDEVLTIFTVIFFPLFLNLDICICHNH